MNKMPRVMPRNAYLKPEDPIAAIVLCRNKLRDLLTWMPELSLDIGLGKIVLLHFRSLGRH